MSTLYFKGNTVYIGFTLKGKRRDRSTRIKVKQKRLDGRGNPIFPREATDFQQKLDAKIRLGLWGMEEKKPTVKISEAFARYLVEDGADRKPGSKMQDEFAIGKLVALVGDCPVRDVDEETMFSVRSKMLASDNKHNTVAKTLRHLSAFFSYTVRKGYAQTNPVTANVKLKPKKTRVIVYSTQEIQTLMNHLRTHDKPVADQLMFLLLTGFRASESCAMTWDSIDFSRRLVYHFNEKGERHNPFPIYNALDALLRGVERSDRYVFPCRTRHQLYNRLQTAISHALPGTTHNVHQLKKTFISNLIVAGASIAQLHILGNHKSIQTTMDYYNALSASDLSGVLEKSTATPLHPILPQHLPEKQTPTKNIQPLAS